MSSPIGFRQFSEDDYRKFIRTLSDDELIKAGKRLRVLCGDVVLIVALRNGFGRVVSLDYSLQTRTSERMLTPMQNAIKTQEAPKGLDFAVLGEPLNKLLIATGNKLTREWPARYSNCTGARELFVMHVRTSRMTYLSALYLCADRPPDPLRLPEFSVSVPMLNRSILDSLFTILFILEDVPSRVEWFWESDWKETRLELDRYIAEYGGLPEWQVWLNRLKEHCDEGITYAKLSAAQAANPKALRRWPNPGSMSRFKLSPNNPLPAGRAFMKYLNDYFYIDLSQQAHLGGWGLVKRAPIFLDGMDKDPRHAEQLERNRYASLGQSVGLVLALASEIEAHFNFGLRQQARFIWGLATPYIEVVKEMYQKRYEALLA
jgi:hypothetical protein